MTLNPKRTATVGLTQRYISVLLASCLGVQNSHVFLGVVVFSVAKKIDELQEILRKKDEDMKQMEQRYKRYMEKARTVSRH